ncbi:MAG: serine/threonine protein kinase [Sandaracinaceae bacterium]|nr:serine/threonine protein kinase [Sandaracinaceae bacterium]
MSDGQAEVSGARPVRPGGDRSRVGRYRLAYELASGGMATVYMACVEGPGGFDKVVALKRIHHHLASEARYVTMFLDEARLASRIDHPNVVSVIDFGEEDGDYFLVMEFLLGVPLSRVIAALARSEDRVPTRWAAIASRLVAEACEGLHAAHELRDATGELLGVVHRDVSPQNLFVGFDGILRVVDFGIAKAAGKQHQTVTGEMKGKLAYMSPEQIRGGDVDRRADVWALGVVLWEMLTFRRLFRKANEVDAMYHVLEGEIVPPSELTKSLPAGVDEIVATSLERDLAKRFPDARAMARDLSRTWGRELTEPVDAAEVAQLLDQLFPGEEERQRNLVELARYRRDQVPRVTVNPGEDSGLRDDLDEPISRASQVTRAAPRRRGVALAVGVAVVAALLGAGLVLFMASGSEPPPPVAAVAADTLEPPDVATRQEVTPETSTEADEDDEEAPAAPSVEPDVGDPVRDEPADAPVGRRRRSSPSRPPPSAPSGEPTPEAPPAPTPAPEASGPGRLVVVVPGGWANVYEGSGRFLGATPINREMPAGRHRLQLRFNGQPPPVEVEVVIPAGGVGRVSQRPPS